MSRKIILVRHMETVWNEQRRYIGSTDLRLSALGERHAQSLAQSLKDSDLASVISSNMKRAQQTALAIVAGRELTPVVEPELREIDFGEWEGLDFDEISTAYPDLADIWVEDPFSVRIPGGESMTGFVSRVKESWSRIRVAALADEGDSDGDLLIVTHAGCIKVILGALMGLDDHKVWGIYQEKGAVNTVEVALTGDRVIEINDVAYRG
jgi:broad specificity phosphatase PhoE